QKQFWEDVARPRDQRRANLSKDYLDTTQGLLDVMDKLSNVLAATVNHQDAEIDQLLSIKQNAWLLRNTAGEASLIVSTGLAAGKITPETAQRMGTAVAVAERALDEARDYAAEQYASASRALAVQIAMLTFAIILTVGAMITVTRRVIRPLHNIRDAMLKVAGGDLLVDSGYLDRKDEIGALAGALATFTAADSLPTVTGLQALAVISGFSPAISAVSSRSRRARYSGSK
ncbi:MAG: HAMP domain-containing protein, partial [Bradyrhizobium guangdongense]